MPKCRKCLQDKLPTEFYLTRGRPETTCKDCRKALVKAYRVTPAVKERESARKRSAAYAVYRTSARHRYAQHKGSAKRRGIEFKLSYAQWLDFWGEHFAERGVGPDALCMARNKDCGPYALGNVSIKTNRENLAEGWAS
jgi:hypothetical protein